MGFIHETDACGHVAYASCSMLRAIWRTACQQVFIYANKSVLMEALISTHNTNCSEYKLRAKQHPCSSCSCRLVHMHFHVAAPRYRWPSANRACAEAGSEVNLQKYCLNQEKCLILQLWHKCMSQLPQTFHYHVIHACNPVSLAQHPDLQKNHILCALHAFGEFHSSIIITCSTPYSLAEPQLPGCFALPRRCTMLHLRLNSQQLGRLGQASADGSQ